MSNEKRVFEMELTPSQFEKIKPYFCKEKPYHELTNHQIINAILYVGVRGCKWSHLPKQLGNAKFIYYRMIKWAKSGVLETVFSVLQEEKIIRVKGYPELLKSVCLDDKSIRKKQRKEQDIARNETIDFNGHPRVIWLPNILKKQIQERSKVLEV